MEDLRRANSFFFGGSHFGGFLKEIEQDTCFKVGPK